MPLITQFLYVSNYGLITTPLYSNPRFIYLVISLKRDPGGFVPC